MCTSKLEKFLAVMNSVFAHQISHDSKGFGHILLLIFKNKMFQ